MSNTNNAVSFGGVANNGAYVAGRNREEWLNAVACALGPVFASVGAPLPKRFRVTMSLTKNSKHVGVCYAPACSADGTTEILIRLDRADEMDVAAILAHELVHAAVGCSEGHKGEFKRVALAIGLEGKMTATTPGEAFKAAVAPILKAIGPLPHAPLNFAGPKSGPKKQVARLLKAECGECGYTVRVTKTWVVCAGAPICPCNRSPMAVEMPEEE